MKVFPELPSVRDRRFVERLAGEGGRLTEVI